MVPLGHLADALHSGHGSLVILGEVQADAVRELGTKLGAGGDGDGGLSPAQLNELVQGDLQSGELATTFSRSSRMALWSATRFSIHPSGSENQLR